LILQLLLTIAAIISSSFSKNKPYNIYMFSIISRSQVSVNSYFYFSTVIVEEKTNRSSFDVGLRKPAAKHTVVSQMAIYRNGVQAGSTIE